MTTPSFTDVIKIIDGKFRDLPLHLQRIDDTSLRFFGKPLEIPLNDSDIPEHLKRGTVKCRIVYGMDKTAVTFEPYFAKVIKSVSLVHDSEIEYGHKFEDRTALNKLLAQKGNCDEILIVKNNYITDTSYTNVVFKDHKGGLYTPSTPLLAGTKRGKLLSKNRIQEREITIDNISNYKGFYMINAMLDLEDDIFIETASIQGIQTL